MKTRALSNRRALLALLAFMVIAGISLSNSHFESAPSVQADSTGLSDASVTDSSPIPIATDGIARYHIDASQSKFTVRAFAGGLLSAFAHDHTIAVRNFTGETQFTYGTFEPASMHLTVKAGSLAVTDKVSEKDRNEIEHTMREQVLETEKYPDIVFRSTNVSATKLDEGKYQVKMKGDLSLHGETRSVLVNAQVELSGNSLRARGEIPVRQSSFNIKPVSVAGGTVKVKDDVKILFDLVAH